MRIVALFVALPAVFALYAVVFGTDPPIWILGHRISGRFESALVIVGCVAVLLGIYRRAKIIWWTGWVVLALSWLGLIAGILSPAEWRDAAPLWFAVIAHLAILALMAYFTYRWYQQRTYFVRESTQEV